MCIVSLQPDVLPLLRGDGIHLPHRGLGDRNIHADLGGPGPDLQGAHWRHLPGVHRQELPQPRQQQVTNPDVA